MTQKVLVTGARGQLGCELGLSAPSGLACVALTRAELDIADALAVAECLRTVKPDVVINAGAYTSVDRAESEPEAAALGNALGPENLAGACSSSGIRLIHLSTDFVFDGRSSRPYRPDDATGPVSEYGRSKLAGEKAVLELANRSLVVRTGWVYSRFGGNFVKTMLRLMSERDELGVVADQVGTPTWARGLADAIWRAVALENLHGLYHWSDAGVCSWYDFAVAIYEEGLELGLLSTPVHIRPIAGASYPTPARRPAYSVLDKTRSWEDLQCEAVHWRVQLRAMLKDIKEQGVE